MSTLTKLGNGLRTRLGKWLLDLTEELEGVRNEERNRAILARLGRCGSDVRFLGYAFVTGASSIEMGDHVRIGSNAYIRGEGGLTIGDNTHISRNLVLYTINHNYQGSLLPYDYSYVGKPVRVGRNVWIGMNVCIVPGATIGDGAVVGMGTVVRGVVPACAVVAAAGWQIIGERDIPGYRALDQARAYRVRGGLASGRPDE